MFFLGASANILVYLLVSIFFALCLYFNIHEKAQPVLSVMPVVISYEAPKERPDSVYLNFYEEITKKEIRKNEPLPYFVQRKHELAAYQTSFSPICYPYTFSLRAPPSFSF